MPKDEWISAPEAMTIISTNSGRQIHSHYLHLLWKYGKVARKAVDGRTFVYRKKDVDAIYVFRRGEKRTKSL